MRISKANREDLQEILQLQRLAYQSEAKLCNNPNIPPLTQTLEEMATEFAAALFLKAVDDDEHIVASVRAHSENGVLHIGKLMVHPDLQGQGIGTKLLEEIETACPHERYELFTSTKSERNIKLYERAGYGIFKERDMGNGLRFVYLRKDIRQ
jgi:ribosomal protein S18 acetylase RimI-like enzyme